MRDPATGQAYEYRTAGPLAYQLCASFAAASDAEAEIRWRHPVGRACFSFTPARDG